MREGQAKSATKAALKCLLSLVFLTFPAAFAAEQTPAEGPDFIPLDDPKLQQLLARIEAAGAYDIPAVNLKKDANYAQTSVDVEPFGGTKPFKENFLTQLTYWGAGRAKAEPEDLTAVKVGFIGPIQPTANWRSWC